MTTTAPPDQLPLPGCTHWWLVPPASLADGGTQTGTCRWCGAVRTFRCWEDRPTGRRKPGRGIVL
jgi:hypothetical protein